MCLHACSQSDPVFVISPAQVILSSWWPVAGGAVSLFHTLGNRLSGLTPQVTQLAGGSAGVWNPGLSAQPLPFLEVTEPPCPSGPPHPPTKMCAPGEVMACIWVWENPAKSLRR